MIEAPHTYSEWVSLLKQYASGDNSEEVVAAMKSGTIEWQSGVADRFAKHFANAINDRIENALDRFEKALERSTDAEEAYVRSLNALKADFCKIYNDAHLDCIPSDDRSKFASLVVEAADRAQQSLEDSAQSIDKTERTGRIPSIIRSHAVNKF